MARAIYDIMSHQKIPPTTAIRGQYDILKDSWDTIQEHLPRIPVTKPKIHPKYIPIETIPHIHRRDTRDEYTSVEYTDNESRSMLHQHDLGSIPVRLQFRPKYGREGAEFSRSIKRMSNRDRRRMTAYNAKKVSEVNGTSLV